MKDTILKIIQSKVHIQKARSLAGTEVNILEGEELAANELTALMCYREVRAYCAPIISFLGFIEDFEDTGNAIYKYLKDSYNEETILQAIEQVKKEQK